MKELYRLLVYTLSAYSASFPQITYINRFSVQNPSQSIKESIQTEFNKVDSHEVCFDSIWLTSGVYFCIMWVNDPESSLPDGKAGSGQAFITSKKIVLVR